MASLNLDLDFFDHPKVKRLSGLLGRNTEALLLRLWCYVGKHYPADGRLTDCDTREIEALAGWTGISGRFVEALLKLRFAERDEAGVLCLHEWIDHAGHIEVFRQRSRAATAARWNKLRPADLATDEPPAATGQALAGRKGVRRAAAPKTRSPQADATVKGKTAGKALGATFAELGLLPPARAAPGPVDASRNACSNASSIPCEPRKQSSCSAVQCEAEELSPAAAPPEGSARASPGARRSSRPRVLTPEQEEARKAFGDWWCGAWPRFHGGQLFEFVGSRDGPAILDLMRRQLVNWDPATAREVAEFYLKIPEVYYPEHPLWPLAKRANYLVRQMRERRVPGGDRYVLKPKPTAAERGEYAENLPLVVERFADDGDGPAKAASA